jgi:menaquinone-dependent protoporphyrinogen oxidase
MKILIVYASRHGATEGIAVRIADTLERHGLEVTLRRAAEPDDIAEFDAFVIGSAAYMGHWDRDVAAFARRHAPFLSTRPVWLYSSGPVGSDRYDAKGRDQLEASRPREFDELTASIRPREEKVFFGAYDPGREGATLAERLVMKVPAIREAMPIGDFRDWPAIEAWAEGIARELGSLPVSTPTPA